MDRLFAKFLDGSHTKVLSLSIFVQLRRIFRLMTPIFFNSVNKENVAEGVDLIKLLI